MSSGPLIGQSQPGNSNIVYFGSAPYPTTGYLRAGNDAGLILTYRNFANNKDLPGIGIGTGVANRDFILFAGILAGEMTSGVGVNPVSGSLKPASAVGAGGGVSFGDTFNPFIQIVGETIQAVSHYDGIHTPTLFQMAFFSDGNGEHSELSTQDGSLIFNAGGINTRVELFNIGTNPGRQVFRPYNANTVGLGDAGNPWYGLFLKAGDTTVPAVTFAAGVAPTAPANGQMWFTAAGLFYQAGGVTVGPLGAGGGGGGVSIQNAGVALAGGPFTTLNYAGGGVTNGGGGIANIPAGGGGISGLTTGAIPVATSATTIGDSQLSFENLGGVNGYKLTAAQAIRPASNNSGLIGQNTRQWDEGWFNNVKTNNGNPLNIVNNGIGGVTVSSGAGTEVSFGPATFAGHGIQLNRGVLNLIGTNGAGATALAITNAPNNHTPQWIPIQYANADGWILFVPA